MKKTLISISIATSLLLNNANAGGIPTIDVAAIAQQVMGYTQTLKDYAEQIKQYEQMVKDTLNFEKQMKELGVDMDSVYEILGDVQTMVSQMQNLYNDVKSIPDDIMGNIARVQTACSFLEQKSSFFRISVGKVTNLKDKANRCIVALKDGANISKEVQNLTNQMNKVIDPLERASYKAQIANLEFASKFLENEKNKEKTNKLLTFQDVFYNGDKDNELSRKKMKDDLKTLAKQLNKANNQKQAQAVTNSLLLKILENLQQQYELNINYTNTMASIKQADQDYYKNLTEESFNRQVVEYKRNDALFEPETRDMPKDELGLPKFIFTKD